MTAGQAVERPPSLRWLRFLDWAQSAANRARKYLKYRFLSEKNGGGPLWRDCTRAGRRFVRVRFNPLDASGRAWRHYETPGWEWNCPNCHDYSIITAGMLKRIQDEWLDQALRLKDRGLEAHIKPRPTTGARVGCPNCKYLPGDPE